MKRQIWENRISCCLYTSQRGRVDRVKKNLAFFLGRRLVTLGYCVCGLFHGLRPFSRAKIINPRLAGFPALTLTPDPCLVSGQLGIQLIVYGPRVCVLFFSYRSLFWNLFCFYIFQQGRGGSCAATDTLSLSLIFSDCLWSCRPTLFFATMLAVSIVCLFRTQRHIDGVTTPLHQINWKFQLALRFRQKKRFDDISKYAHEFLKFNNSQTDLVTIR